jgi:exodeoxyribonuclease VII large subunit
MRNVLRTKREGADARPLTVTQLATRLRDTLESTYAAVHVEGEISGWNIAASGHAYFTIKDDGAALSCVLWASDLGRLRFRPADGMKVEIHGRASLFTRRGSLQIIAERMSVAGEGDLFRRFLELKARLEAEGLFDAERKRALPRLPRAIGVVTSPTGAVIHDIANVLRRRAPWLPVLLWPARVQGDGAAAEVASAIARLAATGRVDVMIVGRGGGSMEDLWSFNEEAVARAVRACPVPVVSAVGHETDFTICDFAADLRAPTPSAAAELVSAGHHDLAEHLDDLAMRLDRALLEPIGRLRRRVEAAERSWGMRAPEQRLRDMQQRVDDALRRMPLAIQRRMERTRARIERAESGLGGHDPDLVLRKGYAIVRRRGRVLGRAQDVAPNDLLRIQFADGTVDAKSLKDGQGDLFGG